MKTTDCDLLLAYLQNNTDWNNAISISHDVKPGCVQWRLGARIYDLKQKGHIIQSRIGSNGMAEYKLVLNEEKEAMPKYQYEDNGQSVFI